MSSTAHLPFMTGFEYEGRWIYGLRRSPTEDDVPEWDGAPYDSDWHRGAAQTLAASVRYFARDRDDWWCAAETMFYFNLNMIRLKDFRAPDVMFVKGVPNRPRKSYILWNENAHAPNAIVEVTSDATRVDDFGDRKEIFQKVLRTPEYFVVDPATREIFGWRLIDKLYVPIAPSGGRLPSEQLGLALGYSAEQNLPRFYDDTGHIVPTPDEAAATG